MTASLKGRSFLTLLDFSPSEVRSLVALAARLKAARAQGREERHLEGKCIALVFEKASTRTRCAFEVAAYQQGAHVTYIGPTGSHLGSKESVRDTARVLGRMYDGIEYRGFGQEVVEALAESAGVPVWNGLTDQFHPTQVLADLLTMEEHHAGPLADAALCYLGDGGNNVAASLLVGAAKLGLDFRIAAPEGCRPDAALVDRCRALAAETGARLTLTASVEEAVTGADFLYTDVWVSMGEPEAAWAERIELLRPYQINARVVAATGKEAKLLHCLPAFHNRDTTKGEEVFQKYGLDGMEVTEEVFEGPGSVVFDQAENRLHTIKAVMVATLGS